MSDSIRLIDGLVRSGVFPHATPHIRVIETHISWVLLTGAYAYKIKKPVDLGFVDFSTLQKRRFFCHEELRLNRRFAPDLYLEVVTIGGSVAAPVMDCAAEPALEVAVRMREFPADALLSRQVDAGRVSVSQIAEFGSDLASLHAAAPIAGTGDEFGSIGAVIRPMEENFAVLDPPCQGTELAPLLHRLHDWTRAEARRHEPLLAERRSLSRVRECHGDLHLDNLVRWENRIIPFDCLEFDPGLRWIDVINEVAFLFMDTLRAGRSDLAYAFLNRYLAESGDYPALALLPFYLVYRAMVRAKVQSLSSDESGSRQSTVKNYLQLAMSWAEPVATPMLIITHGLSGSGKTAISGELITALPAVRLRSDLERKRLHGLAAGDRSNSGLDAGLYSAESGEKTYRRLAELAGIGLQAGFSMIVDAAFLHAAQRNQFARLAKKTGSSFVILACDAPPDVLKARVAGRARAGSDASEADLAVLSNQLDHYQPLTPGEEAAVVHLDTRQKRQGEDIVALIHARHGTGNLAPNVESVAFGKQSK